MARVFISHSSRDGEAAARIKSWLEQQGFDTPFLDFDKHAGIPPGADWERTLYREIDQSQAVLIVQTPNWLDSKWCFAEFTQARALGKAIFPVIMKPTSEALFSPDVQVLDLTSDEDAGLEQLSRELARVALDTQGGFAWDASRPPYPGLLAFQEEDAALYFGRDEEIRRLIERLNARRAQGGAKLIALLGASGSGKSSLMRAGVIPRLKRSGRNWIVLPPMRPQAHPLDELARSMAIATDRGTEWRSLRDSLRAGEAAVALSDLANDLRILHKANEAQILLPVDQAEELFGAAEPDQADRFLDLLSLAMTPDQPFVAILAMRADFLGELQSASHLTARFEEFSLPPMSLARIPEIIEGPARVAGLRVDEHFVQQAARDAETEDALPLLAFALRELYDRAGDDGHLSLADYQALGNAAEGLTPLENAVRRAAAAVLQDAAPSEAELTALREAFVPAMVRVNDQGEYVRRPARWDELPAAAHRLLERLANAYLLIIRQDEGSRMVEVAHEALLRKWPRLQGWLDEAREFLIGKQQLERDLKDWEHAADRDKDGALLTGLKLNRARSWLQERPHQLTEAERRFIEASIRRVEAEGRRVTRLRWIIGTSVAAGLLIAAVLGTLAWLQGQERDRQTQIVAARQLLSKAEALRDIPADEDGANRAHRQSLSAATQALDMLARLGEATFDADQAIRKSYAQVEKWDETDFGPGGMDPHKSFAFDGAGRYLAVYTTQSEIRLYDTASGTLLATCKRKSDRIASTFRVAVAADGRHVALHAFGGTNEKAWNEIAVWSIRDCNRLLTQELADTSRQAVRDFALSADGSALLILAPDGLYRWEVASGRSDRIDDASRARLLAVSPDGQRYAVYEPSRPDPAHWLRIRNFATGSLDQEWQLAQRIYSLSWGLAGLLVHSKEDRLYDAAGNVLQTIAADERVYVLSPNRRLLAELSPRDRITVRDLVSGDVVAESARDAQIEGIVFTPDSRKLVAVGSYRLDLGRWSFAASGAYATLEAGGGVTRLQFSDDSTLLSATDGQGEARWRLPGSGGYALPEPLENTLDPERRPPLPTADAGPERSGERIVLAEALGDAGRRALIVGTQSTRGGYRRTLESWRDGEKLAEHPYEAVLDRNRESFLQFAGQDRYLIIGTRSGLEMVLADSLTPVATLFHRGANLVGVQPNGRLAATMDAKGAIRVWDIASGREISRFAASPPARALEISNDGRWLAALSPDGTIDLWPIKADDLIAQACRWLPGPCPGQGAGSSSD